jgi:hypothetical protein
MPTTKQKFLGKWYYRYGGNQYFWNKNGGKSTSLHRAVWEHHNGPPPPGCHVHHKDGDPANNDIANLEIYTASDHARKHWAGTIPEEFTCVRCGKPYKVIAQARKRGFCSPYCQSRTRLESGIDHEARICVQCGVPFFVNKYTPIKTCSRRCGTKISARKRNSNKSKSS